MSDSYLEEMAECARAAGVEPKEFVLPKDRNVILNGIRLHWLDWGNRHLPHVLLLHGGSLTAHTWDMAVLCLRHKYHFVALDQRGHGDSEWTAEEHLQEDGSDLMLEDTRQFIEYLDLTPLVLVGMSMGGINAIRYTAQYQERLAGLAIVDVAPESMQEGQQEMRDFREATEEVMPFDDFLSRAQKFMPHRPEAHLRYSLMHSLKEVGDGQYTWKRDRRPRPPSSLSDEALKQRAEARVSTRWQEVANIGIPTILFRGANSKILSPAVAERMIGVLPDGRLTEIPDATHNVHSDNPVAFARELDRFLESVLEGRVDDA